MEPHRVVRAGPPPAMPGFQVVRRFDGMSVKAPGDGVGPGVGVGPGEAVGTGVDVGLGVELTGVPTMSARSADTTSPVDAAFLRPVTRILTVCVALGSAGVVYTSACSCRTAE